MGKEAYIGTAVKTSMLKRGVVLSVGSAEFGSEAEAVAHCAGQTGHGMTFRHWFVFRVTPGAVETVKTGGRVLTPTMAVEVERETLRRMEGTFTAIQHRLQEEDEEGTVDMDDLEDRDAWAKRVGEAKTKWEEIGRSEREKRDVLPFHGRRSADEPTATMAVLSRVVADEWADALRGHVASMVACGLSEAIIGSPDVRETLGVVCGPVDLASMMGDGDGWAVIDVYGAGEASGKADAMSTAVVSLLTGHRNDGWCTGTLGSNRIVVAAAGNPAAPTVTDGELAAGIDCLTEAGCGVILIPYYSAEPLPETFAAICRAGAAGAVVVAAGGHGDRAPNGYTFPADSMGVVTAAAVATNGTVPGFQTDHRDRALYAPGVDQVAWAESLGYHLLTGSACAAARVAAGFLHLRALAVDAGSGHTSPADLTGFMFKAGAPLPGADMIDRGGDRMMDADSAMMEVPAVGAESVDPPEPTALRVGRDDTAEDIIRTLLAVHSWIALRPDEAALIITRTPKSDRFPTDPQCPNPAA